MGNNNQNQRPSYRTLAVQELVSVPVPSEGKYMRLENGHSFTTGDGTKVTVPAHYIHGLLVDHKTKVIVFRHFFVNANRLGQTITATVEVVEKTLGDKKYILLNITPQSGQPEYELKFPQNGSGDFSIPGTNSRLWFRRKGN